MENAVATQETNRSLVMGGAPVEEEILSQNIIIPRLLLMQGLSDFVAEGKAIMGEMVRSTTVEKLGGPDKPVEFIPLTFTNTWVISEKVGQKYEYRGQEPLTAANQDLPWEFEKNGGQWKRTKSLNLYALLPSDIEAEKAELAKAEEGEMADPDKALMPVMIAFRSTSFSAGKTISTHFAKAKKFNAPGYVSTLRLKCRKEKNDQGVFYVFEVETAGKTPKEAYSSCEYWRSLVGSSRVQVDEEAESASPGTGGTQAKLGEDSKF